MEKKICIVPESDERSTCPICKKNNLKQLRGHIRKIHKNVSDVERRKLLKRTKKYSTADRLKIQKIPFLHFLMALQHFPVNMRLQRKMKLYKDEFRESWETKSLRPLSKKAKILAWNAYDTYRATPKTWIINEGNVLV